MAGGYKKVGSSSMAKPPRAGNQNRPSLHLFPHATAPRLKPLNTKIYTKAAAKQDPTEFTNIGFGQTGLTGES